jgi:hypothetical protein
MTLIEAQSAVPQERHGMRQRRIGPLGPTGRDWQPDRHSG